MARGEVISTKRHPEGSKPGFMVEGATLETVTPFHTMLLMILRVDISCRSQHLPLKSNNGISGIIKYYSPSRKKIPFHSEDEVAIGIVHIELATGYGHNLFPYRKIERLRKN
ncbi:hypothetical protein Dsin_013856 [Dipteronia sinensis]|uniref:Uncharacterized protein n=1 Tax=Dipteronia sinensis TaxID=43782 RepID=A0AAE0AKU2_9ROSI|nr:hypothetical protein Dsin_013856 [Dipteronia sinensis]